MIFSVEQYKLMLKLVDDCVENHRLVTIEDAIQLEVPFDSLMSFFSQVTLRRAEERFHRLQQPEKESIIKSILYRVSIGESLLSISKEYYMGSYKLAKTYLERTISPNYKISMFLSNPFDIENENIRNDLLSLIASDSGSSIEADLLKESTGHDYEDMLVDSLNALHMCFETEEESRLKGKPRTPDILFMIPMAICREKFDPSGRTGINSLSNVNEDYVVINWIDSKAMFADKSTFYDHLKQLESYRNHYGRGIVIYWQGVVEDVYEMLTDDMILIRDKLPSEWIFPTGERANGQLPAFAISSEDGK